MAGSRVVAHYRDGKLVKGTTVDFAPARERFHIAPEGGGAPVPVRPGELKALFFVRDLAGSPARQDRNEFESDKPVIGRKIRVVFHDGEVMIGTTNGYQPERPGFFLVPADPQSNNERCYVVAVSVREVDLL